MTQVEVLKDAYILIMHMGRQYPFDVSSKAFSTMPLQEQDSNNLLTNFDLLYNFMTYQMACFSESVDVGTSAALSDPGIYVCSTDMIFFPNTSGT
jgi:fucokinase